MPARNWDFRRLLVDWRREWDSNALPPGASYAAAQQNSNYRWLRDSSLGRSSANLAYRLAAIGSTVDFARGC
jgi:hypothetical protein